MIRLTANITAGHIIILSFVGLALMFGQDSVAAGYGVGVGSVLFMIFMYCLELLVAFLQAYVFTLLAALYFGEANQDKHVIIFDTKTAKKKYIKNDFSPIHLILKEKDLGNHNLEGNFVQVYVDDTSTVNIADIKAEIAKNNKVGSLQIKQRKSVNDEHLIQDATAILQKEDEMLKEYVNQVGTEGLDKDVLLNFGNKIIESKI
jgi:hypothetical protein